MSLTPAVWEFKTACMSPAMGRRVAACCKIQARRARDRGKLMVVPASSSASTNAGGCLWACGWAASNCAFRPGRTVLAALRSSRACGESWLVQSCPNVCWPRQRTWLRVDRPSLDEPSNNRVIASAKLARIIIPVTS